MGEEFWWFYDVIAVAVVAVCVFISAKKGLFKSGLTLTGYIVAVALALSISSAASSMIYKNSIRVSNLKKLKQSVHASHYLEKTAEYIESLGYPNVKVNPNKLREIYNSNPVRKSYDEQIYEYVNNQNAAPIDSENIFYEKLHEGYAQLIAALIDDNLGSYPAEYAADIIREKPYMAESLIPLLYDNEDIETDKSDDAAKYISDKLIEKPYKTEVRLAAYLIALVLLIALTLFLLSTVKSDDFGDMAVASHIFSGFMGAVKGVIILTAIAAMIRLYVVMGSDKMLFFNHKAIDNSYIFKYIYSFISDNF